MPSVGTGGFVVYGYVVIRNYTIMDNSLAKKAFLDAFAKTFGNITQSCKAAGISRQTFYNWKETDPDFVIELKNVEPEEILLDFVENKLIQKINEGDTASLIFMAKTKGKKRGYVERQETEISGGLNISWHEEKTYEANEETDKGD